MPLIKNIVVGVSKQYSPQPIVLGQIAAGVDYSLYIKNTGRAWGWGYNISSQLGDNSTTARLTPVSVLGATKTFCHISAGALHTLAIDKNGQAWAWGRNDDGQLGDNSTTLKRTPVSIAGAAKTFCKISGGGNTFDMHSVAIDKNGQAWGWGSNGNGRLGDNSTTSRLTPVSVLGATKTFCHISAGTLHTVAIDKNGQAWGWGYNLTGQIGDNSGAQKLTPVSVAGAAKTFCKISAGDCHTVAIDKNGRAWAWGRNDRGQLGNNDNFTYNYTPLSVAGATKTFCKISGGGRYTVAIDKNGQAWGWGYNLNGQIGDNSTTDRLTPVSVAGAAKTFCKISAGDSHTVAIDKNGQAWAWGLNTSGQLGDSTGGVERTPVSVVGASKTFCKISAGECYTVAIDKNGQSWAWGLNTYGQLADNSATARLTPVSVVGAIKTFCKISAGPDHTVAIDKNGQAWGWGSNGNGRLGDNSTTSRLTPVSVLGATKTFCHISAGTLHTVAIDKNGQAWGWGTAANGRLGNNSSVSSRRTPVSVRGAAKTFCQISAGDSHTVAIDKNGQAWGWGFNGSGRLGTNSTTSRRTPVSVVGAIKTFCQISAGADHTVAIDKNGQAWGWGYNIYGQLGTNSTTSRRTPVSVVGAIKTFCQIAAGNADHTVAIDKNGQAWGWGFNDSGQLGDNSTTSRLTPVSVLGAAKTFCKISAGVTHTVAIDKNGQAWGWGGTTSGQLGNDPIIFEKTPVRVCNI